MASVSVRDGKVYDQSSVELTVDDTTFTVAVEISYDTGEVEEGVIYAGGKPVGRTPGQQKPVPVTIKLPIDHWHQLRDKLGAKYKRKQFNATVTFTAENGDVVSDELNRLRILNDKTDVSSGSEALMQELTCSALEVLPAGQASF